jgi:Flp pilus assembly protein TadG
MIGLRKLRADVRAAAGIIFTLTLVPMVGMLALAIDFGVAAMAREQLNLAADAAALKAVTAASIAYNANQSSNYIATGQAAGVAFFQAQLGTMMFGTATTPVVTVTQANAKFTATVTVQGVVPTLFAPVLGFKSVSINALSAATLTNPKYVAIQIMMDASPSMSILEDTVNGPANLLADVKAQITAEFGAHGPVNGSSLVTAAAFDTIITLKNYIITPTASPNGLCAFACHTDNTTGGPSGKSNDYYGIAQANGLQMRIDVLRTAVQSIIKQLETSSNASYYQVGLYTFAGTLTTISALSSNLAAVYTATNNIQVAYTQSYCAYGTTPPLCGYPTTAANGPNGSYREGNIPDTSFEASAQTLISSTLTPTPTEDGLSASTPLRYLFILTDGVDDYTNSAIGYYCCDQYIYPFNATDGVDGGSASATSACDQIKAAGVTILVLYTPYTPVNAQTYTDDVQPIVTPLASSKVTAALQACASGTENFFQANDAAAIQAALTQMLALASVQVGIFTQ